MQIVLLEDFLDPLPASKISLLSQFVKNFSNDRFNDKCLQ